MTMKPTSHQVHTVFTGPYYIDFYQRDYRWSGAQVETVLADIFYKFDADYRPDLDPVLDNLGRFSWYYLSTLVTNVHDGRKFIVDGQQRLTTLTLILIKLYHMACAYNLPDRAEWLKNKIYGVGPEGKTYWMGARDRSEPLDRLFKGDQSDLPSDTKSQSLTARRIYENYLVVSAYLDRELSTVHRLEIFVLYFMQRIELIELEIVESGDVAMVFEVINDRGERLRPYEVFKGELLGQLEKTEVEQTYLDLWTSSIGPLQDRDVREPDRLFQLLFRSRYVSSRVEYREFEGEYQRIVFSPKWNPVFGLKRNPMAVKAFLKGQVRWYSPLYRRLLAENERAGSYLYFNGTLNEHDRQYLLIMSAISVDDPLCDEKIQLVARLFDRHFALLQLTGSYNTNAFTESIISLNGAVRDANPEKIQAAFDRQLLDDITAARGVEIIDPFQWGLFRNVGSELGTRFLRYFYARLEHFLADGIQLPTDSYFNLVKNTGSVNGYHVEHVLAWNDENRALFGDDDEVFLQQRGRLGALLTLRARDNTASSNEPYAEKLKTYTHATRLAATLSRDFHHKHPHLRDFAAHHELVIEPIDRFDDKAIEERQRLYFEMSKCIWGDESFPRRDRL